MHIYIYMYTNIYIYIYICIHIYIYTHVYIYKCVCIYEYLSLSRNKYIYIYTYRCIYIYIHIYIYICMYVYLYIHIGEYTPVNIQKLVKDPLTISMAIFHSYVTNYQRKSAWQIIHDSWRVNWWWTNGELYEQAVVNQSCQPRTWCQPGWLFVVVPPNNSNWLLYLVRHPINSLGFMVY